MTEHPHPALYRATNPNVDKPHFLCQKCVEENHYAGGWMITRRQLNWTREMAPKECDCVCHSDPVVVPRPAPEPHLIEENRLLELALGEALFELGRAVEVSELLIRSHQSGRKFLAQYSQDRYAMVFITTEGRK